MPRRVFYEITDRPDGLFDTVARIEPDRIVRRDGFTSLAEAEAWVDGLRILMAALGAPLLQEDAAAGPRPEPAPRPEGAEATHILGGNSTES